MSATTMTLAEFLTARLDEDEAAAREAAQDDTYGDRATPDGRWRMVGVDYEGESPRPATWALRTYEYECDREPWHLHVTRHDPARVLAEVEGKRRIVEVYIDEGKRKDIYNRDHERGLLTTDGDLRARHSANARWAGLDAAVRALAAVYADHPDYDETWRP